MADYTTASQVANYLSRPLTAQETASVASVIAASTRWINATLGSRFDKLGANASDPAALEYKQFRGGYRNINIQHCQYIQIVQAVNLYDNTVWYTYTSPLEYIAEPYNNTVKTYLNLNFNEFEDSRRFPRGDVAMKVQAIFTEYDYANDKIPDDIVLMANAIVANMLLNYINAGSVLKEEIEGHLVQYSANPRAFDDDPLVASILESRMDIWLED